MKRRTPAGISNPGEVVAILIMLSFCLLVPDQLRPELHYNLSYSLKGATHGHILIFIPFRVFYESFASMNFRAVKHRDGSSQFYFADIPKTGFMMRTSGFLGKTLVILAADYNLDIALSVAKEKLRQFDVPYYTQYIKKRKPFLFKIHSREGKAVRFKRYYGGVHSDFFIRFPVRYEHHPEILNIDFNIYKILMEMCRAFNHSFLPPKGVSELIANPNLRWKSPPLDYSRNINAIVRYAARIMNKLREFRQERRFILTYRVSSLNQHFIEIEAIIHPDIPIWGKYAIKMFSRKVKMRRRDSVVVYDQLLVKIENPSTRGLEAKVSLSLLGQD